jgi:hypothetical protein
MLIYPQISSPSDSSQVMIALLDFVKITSCFVYVCGNIFILWSLTNGVRRLVCVMAAVSMYDVWKEALFISWNLFFLVINFGNLQFLFIIKKHCGLHLIMACISVKNEACWYLWVNICVPVLVCDVSVKHDEHNMVIIGIDRVPVSSVTVVFMFSCSLNLH